VEDVTRYLSDVTLTSVFKAAGSPRELLTVRLLFNKMDLLEDLLKAGLLERWTGSPEDYAKKSTAASMSGLEKLAGH
jgi:hypothetical protein